MAEKGAGKIAVPLYTESQVEYGSIRSRGPEKWIPS